ncbi:MAG: DEAD/DEAH box helicase [Proteobacteria bacterium]|nr:DEAD/DEAH box helicase [Pseudomonadota bacterium]
MNLTTYQISESFDLGAYARGKKYFLEGKIVSYTVLAENSKKVHITSKVEGSYKSNYTQEIFISKISHGVMFQGNCSCPVGYNCKHIVAVCFQYQYDVSHKPRDKVADWLKDIVTESERKLPSSSTIDDEYFLTYRLFFDYSGDLSVFKSKLLKNGNLSKGGKRRLDNASYYLDEHMNPLDDEIIELVEDYSDYSYKYHFKTEIGFIVLKKIIKTNRAFYKDSPEPLSLSPDKISINAIWKKIDNKRSLLEINLASDTYKLIPTTPIMVIDIQNNQVAQLEGNIEYKALKKLCEVPPIENSKMNEVYQTIASRFSSIELEAPKGYKVTTLVEKPVPFLHIYQGDGENNKTYFLRIEFTYGDCVIEYLPRSTKTNQFSPAGKIEVIRDNQLEDDAVAQLEAFGFKSFATDGKHYLKIAEDINSQQALQVWNELLNVHIQTLEKSGWKIEFNDNFKLSFATDSQIEVESEQENDWFSLSFNIKFGKHSYPLAPLVSSILAEFDSFDKLPKKLFVQCENNQYVELKTNEIKPVLKTLFELFDRKDSSDNLKIGAFDAHMLDDLEDSVTWKGSKEILKLSKKLKNFAGIKPVKPPTCLKLELRDYQQLGLNWLNFLYEFKFSGILADDMGLGKTVQTLSHLSRLKQDKKLKKPALIIVPTSLIANWKNEVEKFTPNLNILTLYGTDRKEKFKDTAKADLILTTYTLVGNDIEQHKKRKHSYIILDEAQKIKNPRTKMAKTICSLKGEHRLALTGTPIENHLGELWSIFNFLMPGFLHNQKLFNEYYRKPIENNFDAQMQQQLNKRIKPFILRRTKGDVLTELPAKTEIIKFTQFDEKQSKLYETIRIAMNKKVKDAIAQKGVNRSHIHILDALLKLRQVCCDPSILKLAEAKKVKESAKLTLFLELIDELMAEGRKVLVFSQFTTMLSILEREIQKKKISYVKLTGSSTKRDKIIDKFTDGQADIFLISLKAGGVGLNLVEADTVIHYDPWWNPAVENQATDRAHRIGQNKKVFVYKLIVKNTIEEKIIELQKKKKALQDGIYDKGGKLEDKKFSGNELMDLLKG